MVEYGASKWKITLCMEAKYGYEDEPASEITYSLTGWSNVGDRSPLECMVVDFVELLGAANRFCIPCSLESLVATFREELKEEGVGVSGCYRAGGRELEVECE